MTFTEPGKSRVFPVNIAREVHGNVHTVPALGNMALGQFREHVNVAAGCR